MRLPILMYHGVDRIPPQARSPRLYVPPEQFEAQLATLRQLGYETISFAGWLAYRRGDGTLPRRPIIITFDDGYRSLARFALPPLRKFGFSATVFLVSDHVGKTNSWDPPEPVEPLLGAGEIAQMQAAGIRFESHTRTHPALTMIPAEQALEQLTGSRAALTRLLGAPVTVLCYPYGKQNKAVRDLARQAGYEAAVIARPRMNTRRTDPFRLTRLWIDQHTTPRRLRWTLFRLRWLRLEGPSWARLPTTATPHSPESPGDGPSGRGSLGP
ncbi:MAG TPA: polysaccharide deacetylase family protein [Gemmatimonadales bacterium]|nr:polysaccharide deacetylase family protein [Gemmatimonadales bacterium]